LFNKHQHSGATWSEHYGWQIPARFTAPENEAAGVRQSVGLADLSWTPKLDLKGYGLKSSPVIGEGVFSWVLGPVHWLVTCDPAAQDQVMKRLEELRTSGSDLSLPPAVYTTDVTSVYSQLLIAGPCSRQVLSKLTSLNLSESSLPNLSCGQSSLAHVRAIILRKDVEKVPAYHLLVSRDYGEGVWEAVVHAGDEFNLCPFGLEAQRLLRM